MTKKNQYSLVNTKTLINFKKKTITKFYCVNVKEFQNKKKLSEIKNEILKYYYLLKKARISLPRIYKIYSDELNIVCVMSYHGKNIFELGLDHKNFYDYLHKIENILKVLFSLKKKKDVMLDPHIKNFVFDKNQKLYYVDLYQPLTKSYIKERISKSKNIFKKMIVKKNFMYFQSKFLIEHFVADLIATNKFFKVYIFFLFTYLQSRGYYNKSFQYFKSIVYKIINVENKRKTNKIYLI